MDQRMIDALDPTSYGGDTIRAVEDDDDEPVPGADEDEVDFRAKKPRSKHYGVTSVFTEDRDWGNRGEGQPILM